MADVTEQPSARGAGYPGPAASATKIAGLLLTGGASSRLGAPKALLGSRGERLVDRTARMLSEVAAPVVEVGPGYGSLPATREEPPGDGPLAGLVAGAAWLEAAAWRGAFLVVAVDLPALSVELLRWLADRPGDTTVVPMVDGVAQPLCARYASGTGAHAARLVAGGNRSMQALLVSIAPEYVDADAWGEVVPAAAFADVDTRADVERAGLEMPGGNLAPDA